MSSRIAPSRICRDALTLVGAGVAASLPAAWALRRLVEAQLFGVQAFDAPTLSLAVLLLLLVALGAAARPAWQAASVARDEALRLE